MQVLSVFRERRPPVVQGRGFFGVVLTALLIVGACSDNGRVVSPPASAHPELQASAPGAAAAYDRSPERPLEEVSALTPSFGGLFIEEGNLVAYSTDPARAEAVRAAVESVMQDRVARDHDAGGQTVQILIRAGEFSFIQLREWRNLATDEILGLPDAVWVDLDEGHNRLAVGLETGAGREAIAQRIAELGVPKEAVIFDVTGRMMEDVTLQQRRRPLEGGLQIARGTDGAPCTLGFNAVWNGQNVFLTNSHCTGAFWSSDGVAAYQNVVVDTNRIGHEIHDPASFRCGTFLDRDDCRYSDAAILLHETLDFNFGYIARTMFRTYGTGGMGSLDIDPANPRMQIVAEGTPNQGDLVNKIGRTTGWTYGNVQRSCFDFQWDDSRLICQYAANYGRGGGDSGSPVFLWYGSTVRLVGIHRGFDESGLGVFSPITGVEQDLGPLATFTPPPPPPMTVTIGGPTTWPPYQMVTVTASVSNGTPPFTYAWLVNGAPYPGCGNKSWCDKTMGGPGTSVYFYVTVTGGDAQQASDWHVVTAQ